MNKKLTSDQLDELESQLSKSSGENGKKLGLIMNTSNKSMTDAAYGHAQLKEGYSVLEIGHGNGAHISEHINPFENIQFHGLEISEVMSNEAISYNQELVDNNSAQFELYDGLTIPFKNKFDRIITVNTLYFWQKPLNFINQLHDALTPEGEFIIAFADKDYMQLLDFVKDRFQVYGKSEYETLIGKSQFEKFSSHTTKENIISKSGESVLRTYHTYNLHRSF